MDIKDQIIQKNCPTVMTPKYSPLPDIESRYRFVMVEEGLWIEARCPWSHFRLPLWLSPRPLPYGSVERVMYIEGGRIPDDLIRRCVDLATAKARMGLEWAGWITWSEEEGYTYTQLAILNESFAEVKYLHHVLHEGRYLVLDLHSHPFEMDRFSARDDHDDSGGIHFSGVISFDKEYRPKITLRLCIEGFFFENIGGGL